MIPNNNLSVLPFYLDIESQNHRKDYAFGEIFSLLTPDRSILPFQIIRDHTTDSIVSVLLKKLNGVTHLDITSEMVATGIKVNQYTSLGYDVITYHGKLPMAISTPEGFYYLEISDGTNIYYSEIFNIVRSLSSCLKIEYSDVESMLFENGRIDYTDSFKFNIYLPTQLGRPEYPFTEQVENRDGYTFVEKQISEKTFKFNFLAPEYLCDAMRIIRMSDNVVITNLGKNYDVETFLMTPKWQDGGYLAAVDVEFQCDTVIKKIGVGITPTTLGDFNNDFNNDFDN